VVGTVLLNTVDKIITVGKVQLTERCELKRKMLLTVLAAAIFNSFFSVGSLAVLTKVFP